jgi:hypothetical protein
MSNGSVSLLTGSVPYLCFNLGGLEGDCFGGELNTDGSFGLVGKLVLLKS